MITTPVKLWRRQKNTASLIGKKGKIVQWTIIRVPSKSFASQAPYPVVIVAMETGENMMGQLVDYEKKDIQNGREVVMVLRRHVTEDKESVIPYIIKFKPA